MSGGIHWELRETGRQRFNPGAPEYEIGLGTANVSRFRAQLAPLPGHTGKQAGFRRPARTGASFRRDMTGGTGGSLASAARLTADAD
jgi:hypothetical protein